MKRENYLQINEPINSTLYSVKNKEYKWGVIDIHDNVIVGFGKYAWIDGFQNGLAKVIGYDDNTWAVAQFDINGNFLKGKDIPRHYEQGIINEVGEEVLPLEYNVWKFYGKDYPTIKAFKNKEEHKFYFKNLNPDYCDDDKDNYYDSGYKGYEDHDELEHDTWDAMTDGQYGDMPEGFDGDYSFLGY